MLDLEFIRQQKVGVRHLADGVAVPAPSEEALRVKRFLMLGGCQELVYPFWRDRTDGETGEIKRRSEFRVSICMRQPVSADGVQVWRNGDRVGLSGLMRCGSAWGCPVCCAKVMSVRQKQIGALFRGVLGEGGKAAMVTLTCGHERGDSLFELLSKFKTAHQALIRHRAFKQLVRDRAGAVVATEIMWGAEHGWHPHQHQAWFWLAGPGYSWDDLADQLYFLWEKVAGSLGLRTIREWRGKRIGVDVRAAWDASEYLAKFDREREWSLDAELTAGRIKTSSKGSLTPWALLEEGICRGNDSAPAGLFVEYLRATRGKAVISLKGAKALCERYGVDTNVDDFADANKSGESEVFATLSAKAYDTIVRNGGVGQFLEAARKLGQVGAAAAAELIGRGEVFHFTEGGCHGAS